MEVYAQEATGYSLPPVATDSHNLSCPYKKRERQGERNWTPFYIVAAMLLAGCCALRRKRSYSGISNQKNESNVSAARWRSAITTGANTGTASDTNAEDGVERRHKHQQEDEAEAAGPKALATPLPFYSQEKVCCTPKKCWLQPCVGSYHSQVFCGSRRADGNVRAYHTVQLSHRQRYSIGRLCKCREHLGMPTAKPCSHKHQVNLHWLHNWVKDWHSL